jgi:threonine synthase
VVAMATAHPAKFPDAVEKATGIRPSLPPRLAHLMSGTERFVRAPNDLAAVETLIRAFVHRNDTQLTNSWGTAA